MDENRSYRNGLISTLGCSTWWGLMPIYWHLLGDIDSVVIIFYRIVLAAAVCFLLALKFHGIGEIKSTMAGKGIKLRYFGAGLLITVNWSLYIWAVTTNRVIQACIGYYIEPLIVCVFGVIFFKERLNRYKVLAVSFAVAGVAVLIIHFKQVPVLALGLALSFAIYAALKKNYPMPPMLSLLYETMFLVPAALLGVIFLEIKGIGALAVADGPTYLLLMFCGLMTAIPLMLFANGANKVDMFTLGITEYISPTLSLILSIFIFKEGFDVVQLIAFAIIWIGLAFFSYGEYSHIKKGQAPKDFYQEFANHDRTAYPEPIHRVTGGMGGEALLIFGSEKTVLHDAGMACYSDKLIENIEKCLREAKRDLDYIILSHTHYDHIGGLPFVLNRWPDVTVFGNEKTAAVFASKGAKATIRELSQAAAENYNVHHIEILEEPMRVDKVLHDGDILSLGKEKIQIFETKGHTDCSVTYLLFPQKILFTSESTGVMVSPEHIHTSVLKDFDESIGSAKRLDKMDFNYLISPHYGVIPQWFNDEYFKLYIREAEREKAFILAKIKEGLTYDEILEAHKEEYWQPDRALAQPYAAYRLNTEKVVGQVMKKVAGQTMKKEV